MRGKDNYGLGQNIWSTKKKNSAIGFDDLARLIKFGMVSDPAVAERDVKIKELSRKALNEANLEGNELKAFKNKFINPLKERQPFFLLGGYCQNGHDLKTLEYNNHLQGDLDFKFPGGDQVAQKFKELLKNDPFIKLNGISPSVFGVKFLVQTDNDNPEYYLDAIDQYYQYLVDAYAEDICEILSTDNPSDLLKYCDRLNAAMPCFIFIDKDLYTNKLADIFHVEIAQQKRSFTPVKVEYSDDTTKAIQEAISKVSVQEGEWEDWYKLAYALLNVCGDDIGEKLFHELSQKSSKYEYRKTNATWKSALKRPATRERQAGFTTIKEYLKEYAGVELERPKVKTNVGESAIFLPTCLNQDAAFTFKNKLSENPEIFSQFLNKKVLPIQKPCLVVPTESGKTYSTFKYMVRILKGLYPKKQIIFTSHLQNIVTQAGEEFALEVKAQIICEGHKKASKAPTNRDTIITFNSLEEYIKRIYLERGSLNDVILIIDELHELVLSSYQNISSLNYISNQVFKCIGLTATYLAEPLNQAGFTPIKCNRLNEPEVNINIIRTKNDPEEEMIKFAMEHRNEKNFFLYNSVKGVQRVDKVINKNVPGSSSFYHAELSRNEKKDHKVNNYLISNTVLPDEINHYFFTKALGTGVNFKGCNFIYICQPGKRDHIEFMQGYARLRGQVKNVTIIMVDSKGEEEHSYYRSLTPTQIDDEKNRLYNSYVRPFNKAVESLETIEGYTLPSLPGGINRADAGKIKKNIFTNRYEVYVNTLWHDAYKSLCAEYSAEDFIRFVRSIPNVNVTIESAERFEEENKVLQQVKDEYKALSEHDISILKELTQDPDKREHILAYIYFKTDKQSLKERIRQMLDIDPELATAYHTPIRKLLDQEKPIIPFKGTKDTISKKNEGFGVLDTLLDKIDDTKSKIKDREAKASKSRKESTREKHLKFVEKKKEDLVKLNEQKNRLDDYIKALSEKLSIEVQIVLNHKYETIEKLIQRNIKILETFASRYTRYYFDFYDCLPIDTTLDLSFEQSNYLYGKSNERLYRLIRLGIYKRLKDSDWYKDGVHKVDEKAGIKQKEILFDIAVIKGVLSRVKKPGDQILYKQIKQAIINEWGSDTMPNGRKIDEVKLKELLNPFFDCEHVTKRYKQARKPYMLFNSIGDDKRMYYLLSDVIPEDSADAYYKTLCSKVKCQDLEVSSSYRKEQVKVLTE